MDEAAETVKPIASRWNAFFVSGARGARFGACVFVAIAMLIFVVGLTLRCLGFHNPEDKVTVPVMFLSLIGVSCLCAFYGAVIGGVIAGIAGAIQYRPVIDR